MLRARAWVRVQAYGIKLSGTVLWGFQVPWCEDRPVNGKALNMTAM